VFRLLKQSIVSCDSDLEKQDERRWDSVSLIWVEDIQTTHHRVAAYTVGCSKLLVRSESVSRARLSLIQFSVRYLCRMRFSILRIFSQPLARTITTHNLLSSNTTILHQQFYPPTHTIVKQTKSTQTDHDDVCHNRISSLFENSNRIHPKP
jgi:hypothetical protein